MSGRSRQTLIDQDLRAELILSGLSTNTSTLALCRSISFLLDAVETRMDGAVDLHLEILRVVCRRMAAMEHRPAPPP
jgi:hypothetical protein